MMVPASFRGMPSRYFVPAYVGPGGWTGVYLNPDTDWMSGRYGIGFHYIQNWMSATKNGGPVEWNAAVDSFDVQRIVSSQPRPLAACRKDAALKGNEPVNPLK